ncbi:hypothetical protein [Massilia endophytica]|uniref:hypothetical protein n=1 Tax=Massilia endophytica TaxID=2899220 RepID=UPI001E4ABCF3|nr:hypothetical protein [Massilia endophytica]UGQ45658.1 hypothetical protein LSQ66_17975 [Massilia endophytica]
MSDQAQNLTVTAKEFEALKKAFALIVLLCLALQLLNRWDTLDSLGYRDLLRMASSAVFAATILSLAFYKWCWRWGPIPGWIGRPAIRGIWIGP